jgi:hypothetical protein
VLIRDACAVFGGAISLVAVIIAFGAAALALEI